MSRQPPENILDLLTFSAGNRGETDDRSAYEAFSAALADILRLSATSRHPRLRDTAHHLGSTTACLYAAYTDTPLKEVCELAGLKHGTVNQHRKNHKLPATRRELLHAWQGLLLSTLFEKDMGGLFTGFQSIAAIIEMVTEIVAKRLEQPDADLSELTKLIDSLTKLSFPFMFLYRDHMDPNLESKVKRLMQKDWTQKTATQIRELVTSPPPSGTH